MRRKALVMMMDKIRYLLRDDFNDTVAAGSVNGTTATPTGGVRTAVDTENKMSIGSGVLSFSGGKTSAAWGDPWVRLPSITRAAGRCMIVSLNYGTSGQAAMFGFWNNTNGSNTTASNAFRTIAGGVLQPSNDGATQASMTSLSATTAYTLAILLRATGALYFIKGGAYTNWTLLYPTNTGNTATLYPGVSNFQSAYSFSFLRIPQNLITTLPIASDAFTRANGVLGNTGGGGSEEAGGSGLAWTAQKGTWGVATNKAACSALSDSLGIATVNAGTTNVMVEVVATRSSGTSGLCLRYTDVNNYIKCVHNGTNLQVIEVVNGTPNTLVNNAATYGATARTMISLNANKVRAYYNEALIGTEATTAIVSGNNHGLYTDDTGATFDNFVVYAKGNGSEYEGTFNRYAANP